MKTINVSWCLITCIIINIIIITCILQRTLDGFVSLSRTATALLKELKITITFFFK